jgi:hypothetical protein
MSVDADRVVNLFLSFPELWSLPAQIIVALLLLYTQVDTWGLGVSRPGQSKAWRGRG